MTGFSLSDSADGAGSTSAVPPAAVAPSAGDPEVPEGLRRVAGLVNTADVETGEDEIGDAAGLRRWLREFGLPGAEAELTSADVGRVLAVREALRGALALNAGHGFDAEAFARLAAEATSVPLGLAVGPDGRLGVRPLGSGVDAALGALFADVVTAVADGSWSRLKVCRADTCQFAYFDSSRNHSRAWCSMAVCGNREKGRSFRKRSRAAGPG